ncbi:splicing factor, proline- and glutamine-rich-like [Bos indicus x Bos taurus]|uniref:splicing factor, proline- and glutamine-rich-like n=1 Tax=Bos indicus x Bos taurus TaxID=30522 RepID=UPI000F7D3395|nr:splicing factor, proline- and glutamine-rich-like [Bos indicus x Bos taurus]
MPLGAVQSGGDRRESPTSQTPRYLERGRWARRGVVPHGPAAQTLTTASARGPRALPAPAATSPDDPPPPPFQPRKGAEPHRAPRRHPPLPPQPWPVPAPTSQAPFPLPPRAEGRSDGKRGAVGQEHDRGRARESRPAGRRALPRLGGRGEAPGDLAESRAKDKRRPAGKTGPGPAATGRRAAPPRSLRDAPDAPDCAVTTGDSPGHRQRRRCVAGGTSAPQPRGTFCFQVTQGYRLLPSCSTTIPTCGSPCLLLNGRGSMERAYWLLPNYQWSTQKHTENFLLPCDTWPESFMSLCYVLHD